MADNVRLLKSIVTEQLNGFVTLEYHVVGKDSGKYFFLHNDLHM